MKRYLFSILLVLLLATPCFSASYYGCANAAINANSTFCDTPTGSCTGDNPQTAATALAGTHSLFANGCTITVPEALVMTAAKLSNKDDGSAMVDGGQFTVTTTGWTSTATSITAAIETGGTTGAALAISGTGNLNPALTLVASTIVGGSASAMEGVADSHTVGTVVVTSSSGITGGSNSTADGYQFSGATGTVTYTGNATGATGGGFYSSGAGAATVSGNCTAGTGLTSAYGCFTGATGNLTVSGNLINSAICTAVNGVVKWTPSSAQKYIKFDGGGTAIYAGAGLGSDAGGTQITGANTAAQVKNTAYFVKKDDGVYTQGTAGGGGAWAY